MQSLSLAPQRARAGWLLTLLLLVVPASAQSTPGGAGSVPEWAASPGGMSGRGAATEAPLINRPPNPPATPVPVDGGLTLLALAGGAVAVRRLRRRGAASAFVVGTLLLGLNAASAQTLRPEAYVTNGNVSATALSGDGSTLYIGGSFTYVGPNTGRGARLSQTSGKVLPGGDVVNATIYASAEDGSGGFYIGGFFTQIGGVTRNRVAHILSDGTLDPAFSADVNGSVYALAVSGGTVYIGGPFTSIDGQPRNRLAALDASTGALVAGFDPDPNNSVSALAVSGGTVYVGGSFATIGGQPRNRIAALDASTGAVVAGFNPGANSSISSLLVSGTTLYVGGNFSTIGAQARQNIAALNASTGAIVSGFNAGLYGGDVKALAIRGTTLYAGGEFTRIGTQTRNRIAAFNASTGALVTGFDANASGTVRTLAVSGSTLYTGGDFTTIGGQPRNYIAAVDASTGALVAGFNPNANNSVEALAVSGGTVYAGGNFTTVGGEIRSRIAALDASTGALVEGFDPNANGTVYALTVSGNTLYAGGFFSTIGGQGRNRIAALDASTGALVEGFNPGGSVSSTVYALAVSGSTVYAGGDFTTIGGQARNRIAALDASTGAVVAGFNPNANNIVRTLAVSGDILYAGGDFAAIGGQGRNRIAALDASTGAAVEGFNPNAGGSVRTLAVSGSTLYAGGTFTTIGGQPRNNLAALNTVDGAATAFNPNANNLVLALSVSGGTVYAGGDFTTIGGQSRNRIAALNASTGEALTGFDPNANSSVSALSVSGTTLYAGGAFTTIGGQPSRSLGAFTLPPTVASSTAPGWRMLAAPVAGLTVQSLTAFNLVGGVPGDPACAVGPFNLFTGYTGGQTPGANGGYTLPTAYTDALAPGKGFYWYFFGPGTAGPCGSGVTASSIQPLPLTLTTNGVGPTADVATTFTAAERASGDDTFYLAGNPFSQGLDLDGTGAGMTSITAADTGGNVPLQNIVQMWDAAAGGGSGGYVVKLAEADSGTNGTGGTSSADDVSVWQGMWVERSSVASPSYPLTLTYAAANRTGSQSSGVFVGRPAGGETVRALRFEVSGTVGGQAVYDGAAALVFAGGSTAAWDAYDGSKLSPLGSPFALLAPVGQDRAGMLVEKASESLPLDPGAVSVPLSFMASGAGTFELRWPGIETLPAEWTAELTDTQRGQTVDMRQSESYPFESEARADWSRRFTVRVGTRPVGAEGDGAATSVGLAYPNPARGQATLTVSVGQTERVRVEVYNVLGQRVLVALDEALAAGVSTAVTIDTARLAAGSYVVRVQGTSFSETRRITVVR